MGPPRSQGELTSARVLVAVAVVAIIGCGASERERPAPVRIPARSVRSRACDDYSVHIDGFLDRFRGALDTLQARQQATGRDDADRGEAVSQFADFLVGELAGLRSIDSRDATLRAAHGALVVALEQVARGHEQLATAFALGDAGVRRRALDRLARAWGLWSDASRAIVARCRAVGSARARPPTAGSSTAGHRRRGG